MRARVWVVFLVFLAACSDTTPSRSLDSTRSGASNPGVALEGSIATGFTVHLYRFGVSQDGGGAVVQLHPSGNNVSVTITKVDGPDVTLTACPVEVGRDHPRTNAACSDLKAGSSRQVDLPNADGQFHVAFIITSSTGSATVVEAAVAYVPGDNFLAVDFVGP